MGSLASTWVKPSQVRLLQADRGWGSFQITNQRVLWKCMQMKDANHLRVFLHLQPAPPALGEHFLPFDRKDGRSSRSRKQASGWRSEVLACWPGGHPSPPHLLTTARPSWLPSLGVGVPPSPAPASGDPVHTQSYPLTLHLFLVQHKLRHAQILICVSISVHT